MAFKLHCDACDCIVPPGSGTFDVRPPGCMTFYTYCSRACVVRDWSSEMGHRADWPGNQKVR